jgi:eukaryotic-like serine/threonine-protein kinase
MIGGAMERPDRDPLIGRTIDGCVVVARLAAGHSSNVYLAEHAALREAYAIKVLRPEACDEESTVERFFRQAQALAQLDHPAVPRIYNVGQEGPYYFLRMARIEGETAATAVERRGRLPHGAVAAIGEAVADALDHAHRNGLVHRQVSPHHVLLEGASIRLVGWGLVKNVSASIQLGGPIVGPPHWMSPEQAGGKPVDARTDVYSLGVVLYYLLTGVKPFNGPTPEEVCLKHFFYTPEDPRAYVPELPDALCQVVFKCIKKMKKERYQSAGELARDLAALT